MATPLKDMEFTVGDTAPSLEGSVGANMTGATGQLNIHKPDGTVLSRAVAWTDEEAGDFTFEWIDENDLDQPGRFDCELDVTYSNGKGQTFWKPIGRAGAVSFFVREQYA